MGVDDDGKRERERRNEWERRGTAANPAVYTGYIVPRVAVCFCVLLLFECVLESILSTDF